MAELRKAGGATSAVTAFIAYYIGFADLVAVGGITLPLGKARLIFSWCHNNHRTILFHRFPFICLG